MDALRMASNYGIASMKNDFIDKYGDISQNYPLVNPIGKSAKSNWYLIITFISLFGVIFSFGYAFKEKNKKKNKENNLTKYLKIFLKILGSILLGIMAITGYYGSIDYYNYLIEYNKWYNDIPSQGKILLASINSFNDATKKLSNN